MNPTVFKVLACQLEKTGDALVPKDLVEQGIMLSNQVQDARDRAAAILCEARQQRDDERRIHENDLQALCQQTEDSIELWKAKIKDEIIRDTLQWLVESQAMEREIIHSLRERIQNQCKAVMSHWAADENPSTLLVHRLTSLIADNSAQQGLTLSVAPVHMDKMIAIFGNQLAVVEDSDLDAHSAVLASSLLNMRIDLTQHLNLLLKQLTEHEEQEQDYGTDQ